MILVIHDRDVRFQEEIRNSIKTNDEICFISNDNTIVNCVGCFGCWIKTPTVCVLKDKYNHMSDMMAKATDLIIISKCTYGMYSPFVKNVLDRSISYIHPDFTMREGEMHHKLRYTNRIKMRFYFYGDVTDEEKKTAERLVKANAVNLNGIVEKVKFISDVNDLEKEAL